MKRYGYLFEKIVDIQNIEIAIHNASKRKKNRHSVKMVLKNPTKYALAIQEMLVNGTWKPSKYYISVITDNSSGKTRTIFKPKFYPDQIIHWAIRQITQYIFYKGMDFYCCGSVPGRGGKRGYTAVKKWLKNDSRNTKYCLQIDIKQYYPSINQSILMDKIKRKIKDERCLKLLGMIVYSTPSGLPIGNYTSQWLANFYLQDLDHYIKEELKAKYMIRYMDDIVIFGSNKKQLHRNLESIKKYISSLDLNIKSNHQVFRIHYIDKNGLSRGRFIDFLGFRFYRNHITLRRRNALRIKRRIKKISKKKCLTYRDSAAINSYLGWIYASNSYKYFKKYIEPFISVRKTKEVISIESRKQHSATKI